MSKFPSDVIIPIGIVDRYSLIKYQRQSIGDISELEKEIRALEGKLSEIDSLTKIFESGNIVFDIVYNRVNEIKKKKEY